MKKKWIIFLLAAVLLAGFCVARKQQEPENALPPMLMVDGQLYQLYDFQKEPPEGLPDGEIRQIVGNRLPTENGQANFGYEGMPYWKTLEGICVFVNVNYLLFEVQE